MKLAALFEAPRKVRLFAQFRESPDSDNETQAEQLQSIIDDVRDAGGTISKKKVVAGEDRMDDVIYIIASASTAAADDVYSAIDERDDSISVLTDEHDDAGFLKAAQKIWSDMKLLESKAPTPIKGWVAYMDTGSGEPKAVFAFKQEAAASAYFKSLKKELKGSNEYAFEVDHIVDSHYLVVHAGRKFNQDEFHVLGFHKSRSKLESDLEKQVEEGEIHGIYRIEEIEFMQT